MLLKGYQIGHGKKKKKRFLDLKIRFQLIKSLNRLSLHIIFAIICVRKLVAQSRKTNLVTLSTEIYIHVAITFVKTSYSQAKFVLKLNYLNQYLIEFENKLNSNFLN